MIVFGLISSLFDYCTFWVLLHVIKADERLFQTGWHTESVILATLIVLVIRIRLPFFKSLPGIYLTSATILVITFTLRLPYMPFVDLLGLVKLPLDYYGWIGLIIETYILAAELAKRWFFRTLQNNK